jgi:TolA-binding protein
MIRTLACLVLLIGGVGPAAAPAAAGVSEPDRLWTVGVKAFDDALYDVSYRELGRFLQVARDDPRRGDAAVLRGKAAFALGRYPEALTEFQVAETLPLRTFSAGEPLFWQAEVLFRLRRFDQARERYTQCLRAAPGSGYAPDALYARGFSELELNLPEEATATFDTLLREHPSSELAGSAAYTAARELVRAERWDEALALLGGYAGRFPRSRFLSEAQYLLGVAQLESGLTAEGVRSLEQFVARNATHELTPTARMLLGGAHAKAGRSQEAIDHYRAVIRLAPTSPSVPQALYQIGDLSQRLGRLSEAETAWKTLRRDHPKHELAEAAGLELAALLLRRGRWEPAAEAAREVADANGPQRLEALLLVGEGALKAGKAADAQAAYAAAVAEAPADSPSRFRALAGIGLVAEFQKEPDAAKRAYGEIIDKADDEELVKWARGRVQGLEEREKPPPPRPVPKAKPRSGTPKEKRS